jgi:hypothetical protein
MKTNAIPFDSGFSNKHCSGRQTCINRNHNHCVDTKASKETAFWELVEDLAIKDYQADLQIFGEGDKLTFVR